LHNITKKGVKGPPPWIKGSDYDNAFHKLKVIIANTKLYLHHKDALRRLFLEVNVSDVGWGACAYQMLKAYIGDPKDEGRMQIGDTGPRQIIQWISKAWTTHELTLPVFYRESHEWSMAGLMFLSGPCLNVPTSMYRWRSFET
jgi:hypothetical protein